LKEFAYLDLADYLLVAEAVLGVPAEQLADMPRVVNMASSALAVPKAGWSGKEAYPEFAQKAALLAARLVRNHPLPDGNKRVAWLSMVEFIERNGGALLLTTTDPGEVVSAMVHLAAGDMSEQDFVDWVRRRLDPYRSMADAEFERLASERGWMETSSCSDCLGRGRDHDGSVCVYCGGEGKMARISDMGMFVHMLVQRGLFQRSDLDLAAWVSLTAAFGPDWANALGAPTDASPSEVWIAVLRAAAENPSEGEVAVDRWLHRC
jgi:death-on-curing protein